MGSQQSRSKISDKEQRESIQDLLQECQQFLHELYQECTHFLQEVYGINDEMREFLFYRYLLHHFEMQRENEIYRRQTLHEVPKYEHRMPGFVKFMDENVSGGVGKRKPPHEWEVGPFWDKNVKYYEDLSEKRLRQICREYIWQLKEQGATWSLDKSNQEWAMVWKRMTRVEQGDLEGNPLYKVWSVVYKGLTGVEVDLCGSMGENVATTPVNHDEPDATDVDVMWCFPLKGTLHDTGSRYGYTRVLNTYHDTRYKTDQENFISSRHYLETELQDHQEVAPFIAKVLSGPALGMYKDPSHADKSFDYVFGFYIRDRVWPAVADEWRKRDRRNLSGWPTQELINKAVSHGTYVVAVGHRKSPNKDYEWRYSFSQPEKDLMLSITRTQRKCFLLVKHLCKLSFSKLDIMCSYFVKTSFFWMLEQTPAMYWDKMSMDELVDFLLDKMIFYFANHNLPNYFITRANIIDHLTRDQMRTALQKLQSLKRTCKIPENGPCGQQRKLPLHILSDYSFYCLNCTVDPCGDQFSRLYIPQHFIIYSLKYGISLNRYQSNKYCATSTPRSANVLKLEDKIKNLSILSECPEEVLVKDSGSLLPEHVDLLVKDISLAQIITIIQHFPQFSFKRF